MRSSRRQATLHRGVAFSHSNLSPRKRKKQKEQMLQIFGSSVEIRNAIESMRSSPHRASVHRTLAFRWFESLPRKRKRPEQQMLFWSFWSECRDSNSRPLEPHSSAIPNFATPGYFAAPQRQGILPQLLQKIKYYFSFFQKILPLRGCRRGL